MNSFNQPLVLYLFFLFLSGCMVKNNQVTILIDNPSSEIVFIAIDQDIIEVPPNATLEYVLDLGYHSFGDGSNKTSRKIEEGKNYLLNPTLSTYILEEYRYSKSLFGKPDFNVGSPARGSKNKIPVKSMIIEDTIPIIGAFEELKGQLFIEGFDININREVPKTVSAKGDFIEEVFKVKLYRWEEFLIRAEELSPVLKMRKKLKLLDLANPTLDEELLQNRKLVYLSKRKELFSQPVGNLPKKKAQSDTRRMAIMEINTGNELLTLAVNAENIIILISTSDNYNGKTVASDSHSDFFNSSFMLQSKGAMKETSEFPMANANEVRFHTWRENGKYTEVLPLRTVYGNQSLESRVGFANVNNLSDLYITGEKILNELK